jgi:hypothetical protein
MHPADQGLGAADQRAQIHRQALKRRRHGERRLEGAVRAMQVAPILQIGAFEQQGQEQARFERQGLVERGVLRLPLVQPPQGERPIDPVVDDLRFENIQFTVQRLGDSGVPAPQGLSSPSR